MPNLTLPLDPDVYDWVAAQAAENNQTKEAFAESLIEAWYRQQSSRSEQVLRHFREDLITGLDPDDPNSIYQGILDTTWEALVDDDRRTQVQDALLNADGTVYLTGQGSSLSVAYWLGQYLSSKGVETYVDTTDLVDVSVIGPSDTLVGISQSGETSSVVNTAEAADDVGVMVAVCEPGSSLVGTADVHVPVVPIGDPQDEGSIDRHVDEYAVKSLYAQLTTLHTVLEMGGAPSKSALQSRFADLSSWVSQQFSETGGLTNESDFAQVASEIQEDSDVPAIRPAGDAGQGGAQIAPIVASLGAGHAYGYEMALKLTELLHVNAAHEDVGSIKDRLLNVLYQNRGYLLTIIPPSEDPEVKQRRLDYLDGNSHSINNMLATERRYPRPFRLVMLAFGELTEEEASLRGKGAWGRAGTIQVSPDLSGGVDSISSAPLPTQDLFVYAALHLYVLALLEASEERADEQPIDETYRDN
ncbi:SIS domain-containing protein [Halolamina salina]|uniref:SIS domain-containing protein n=1 Tax=Halolamina salina TaxID=1220023 RepID=A0ABD6B9J2_9EURY